MEPKNELPIDEVMLLTNVIGIKKAYKKMPAEFGSWQWSPVAEYTVGDKLKEELVRDYFLKQADSYKAAIARGEHFENENLFREALSPLPEVQSPEVQSPKVQSPKLQKMTVGTSSSGVEIPEEAEELIDKPVDETAVKEAIKELEEPGSCGSCI